MMPAFMCAGCHFSFPKVANVAVQQGNVITQEMIDRLKPGMTRRQVAFVMGEPVVRDPGTTVPGAIAPAARFGYSPSSRDRTKRRTSN